jgi:ubiquinone/menaquinone biosynthesis C-methylase UbiE
MFGLFSGPDRLREQVVDACGVTPGTRVLELGCGPGRVTARLLARGAEVVAVDHSAAAIARARRRAPGATLVQADVAHLAELAQPGHPTGPRAAWTATPFDVALFSFVLHELTAGQRTAALSGVWSLLRPDGRVVIADHGPRAATLWGELLRRVTMAIEPPGAAAWVESGFERHLPDHGLTVLHQRDLAGGLARLVVATRRS